MAVTANVYNHTAALIAGQQVSLDDLKVMLLTSGASFIAAHTTVDAVAGAGPTRANEFYGNDWPQGGKAVTSVAASTITTNDARVSGDQISQDAANTGPIGPCRYVLLYDTVSLKPLILYDLGQDEYAGATTPFKLTFDLTGTPGTIYTVSV